MWGAIRAAILAFFALLSRQGKREAKQAGRDQSELEGRREMERVDSAFRNADPDSVSDDEITRG